MERNLNDYISKRHIKMVEKFNNDLIAFAKETDENPPTLYEDAFTSFTLSNMRVENGCLLYEYDGRDEEWQQVFEDEETGEMWEPGGVDGIVETIKYYRSCLRRAKRYWSMDTDKLDRIQSGDVEDKDDWSNYE